MRLEFHLALEICLRGWRSEDRTRTREHLANTVGVTVAALGHWLNGRRDPNPHAALKLVKIFCSLPKSSKKCSNIANLIWAYEEKFPDRSAKEMWDVYKASCSCEPPPISADNGWPGPLTLAAILVGVSATLMGEGSGLSSAVFVFVSLVFVLFTWLFEVSSRTQDSRNQIAEYFKHERYSTSYADGLSGLLDKTDTWFTNSKQRELRETDPSRAWTAKLFARTLMLSLLYPFVAIVIQWLVLGRDVWFGETGLLYDAPLIGKIVVVAFYSGAFVPAVFSLRYKRADRFKLAALAFAFATAGLLLLGLVFGPPQEDVIFNQNWFMGSLLTIILFGFILVCRYHAFDTLLAPSAGIIVGASVQSIFSAEIEGIAAAIVGRDDLSLFLVMDGILAAMVIVTIALLVGYPLSKMLSKTIESSGRLPLIVHVVVVVGAVWLMAYGAGHLDNPYYFIMLGLIPVVNAIFDFGSIGLTRWALRSGLKNIGISTILYSFLDLIAALLIFAALGCFCIAVFHFVNDVALNVPDSTGVTVFNLDGTPTDNIFHSFAADPSLHWWLFATFLSTLLPTLVHASVAIWAVGPSLLNAGRRAHMVETFGDAPRTLADSCAKVFPFSIWATFSVVFPVLVLVFLLSIFSDHSCSIGVHLLNFFIHFFQVLIGESGAVAILQPHEHCL